MQTAANFADFTFDNVRSAEGRVVRKAGATVRLRDARSEPLPQGRRSLGVTLAVNYEAAGEAFESYRTWIFANPARTP